MLLRTGNSPLKLSEVHRYAERCHAQVVNRDGTVGQRRKYTFEPYISHPLAVAGMVATVEQASREMVAAALLHDVVEDTAGTLEEIEALFGQTVAQYVDWLTVRTTPADGNRAWRMRVEAERLARAPAEVQTIKLADMIDNTRSIVTHDPKFALVYLSEKAHLLVNLTKGDDRLHGLAGDQIELGLRLLQESEHNPSRPQERM